MVVCGKSEGRVDGGGGCVLCSLLITALTTIDSLIWVTMSGE